LEMRRASAEERRVHGGEGQEGGAEETGGTM